MILHGFPSRSPKSADMLRTHEPGQCLVSLCGALCIFEYFQLQTRKTFQIVSKNTCSRIFSSRPEFSRIGGRQFKDSKNSFSILRGAFLEHFELTGPKRTHFQAFPAFAAKIAPDSCEKLISSIFSSRLELSRIRAETSKTQKAHLLSRGSNFGAF